MGHSLACNLHMWDGQVDALARKFRVARFDMRGHGGSAATEGPYSLDLLAADAAALLEFLGIDEFHYVGLSMGGMVGQMLALLYPSRMKSLVLCDTSSDFELDIRERVRVVETMGMEPMVEPTLQRFLSAEFRRRDPETTAKVAAMIRATTPTGYIGCCHAISKVKLAQKISGISCPVLVVVGEQDAVTPISMARLIKDSIPDSDLAVIHDASHLANVEQPSSFAEEVLRFLNQITGCSSRS
jgi:3-oxoadipate enol-lactonase